MLPSGVAIMHPQPPGPGLPLQAPSVNIVIDDWLFIELRLILVSDWCYASDDHSRPAILERQPAQVGRDPPLPRLSGFHQVKAVVLSEKIFSE